MTELWCEKFVWFDPSPIESFNSEPGGGEVEAQDARGGEVREERQQRREARAEEQVPGRELSLLQRAYVFSSSELERILF